MLNGYKKNIRRLLAKNEEVIRYAEIMVREARYNYQMLLKTKGATLRRGNSKFEHEEVISRASGLYEHSKLILREVDPDNAEAFIQSTYGANTNG
jgi:hypothetical protein